jgi:hypothetical protein
MRAFIPIASNSGSYYLYSTAKEKPARKKRKSQEILYCPSLASGWHAFTALPRRLRQLCRPDGESMAPAIDHRALSGMNTALYLSLIARGNNSSTGRKYFLVFFGSGGNESRSGLGGMLSPPPSRANVSTPSWVACFRRLPRGPRQVRRPGGESMARARLAPASLLSFENK